MQNVVDQPFLKRTYIFMPQAYELMKAQKKTMSIYSICWPKYIPILNHDFVVWNPERSGYHWRSCGRVRRVGADRARLRLRNQKERQRVCLKNASCKYEK